MTLRGTLWEERWQRHQATTASLYQYTLISRAGNSPGGGHTGKGPVVRPTNSTITFDHVAFGSDFDGAKIPEAIGDAARGRLRPPADRPSSP